jgi:hypothetical protein
MTKLITATIFLTVLLMTSYSQQTQLAVGKGKVSLTNDRPTVYLTFERG